MSSAVRQSVLQRLPLAAFRAAPHVSSLCDRLQRRRSKMFKALLVLHLATAAADVRVERR